MTDCLLNPGPANLAEAQDLRDLLDLLLSGATGPRPWRYAEISVGREEHWLRLEGDEPRDLTLRPLPAAVALGAIAALKTRAGLRAADTRLPQHGRIVSPLGRIRLHCCPQWDGELVALHRSTA